MIEYLNHTNMTRDEDGCYLLDVRTQEAAAFLTKLSKEKRIKVKINVIGYQRYFDQKAYFEKLLETNDIFKEFYDILGLKLLDSND